MARAEEIYCCFRALSAGPRKPKLPASTLGPPLLKRLGYGLLAATVKALRVHAACAYPVVVRSGRVPDTMDGFCVRRKARFVIHLDADLSPKNSVAVLIHEWAHARAWNHVLDRAAKDAAQGLISGREFEEICRGPAFGVEYAHCWRVFTGEVLAKG